MQKSKRKTTNVNEIDISNNSELQKFRFLLEKLTEEYINKFEEIQGVKQKNCIPVNIFNKKLSPLETVVKYMKENLTLSFKQIANSLGRSQKTVWQAYKNGNKKLSKSFLDEPSKYFVPISLLGDRKFSILESVVSYLKDQNNLSYHQIAILIKRDERTVWTVYNRKIKK